jgi:hypothetical protein
MKAIYVSLPTAISAAMRLYIAYVLTSSKPDCFLLIGAFFFYRLEFMALIEWRTTVEVYCLHFLPDWEHFVCFGR